MKELHNVLGFSSFSFALLPRAPFAADCRSAPANR